eukprot:CAMPEP_0115559960 /NCGR_PEP_ID=MMETSP0271-20121206/100219_1 /TAXON_ID=71861 /ORGANISM="Scrippsiella trochoidea, Strain CCMP3099" /LENGTH=121 /DNA_ID=CAMNT_0002994015 /DNA_START=294 /DNA_END=653 /DNA_ORIENTATION=-
MKTTAWATGWSQTNTGFGNSFNAGLTSNDVLATASSGAAETFQRASSPARDGLSPAGRTEAEASERLAKQRRRTQCQKQRGREAATTVGGEAREPSILLLLVKIHAAAETKENCAGKARAG